MARNRYPPRGNRNTTRKGTPDGTGIPFVINMVPKEGPEPATLIFYSPKISFTFASNASSGSSFVSGTNVSASTPTGVRIGEPASSIT